MTIGKTPPAVLPKSAPVIAPAVKAAAPQVAAVAVRSAFTMFSTDAFVGVAKSVKDAAKLPPPLAEGRHGISKHFGHKSAGGKISDAEWNDPSRLLSKLTQYPHGRATKQSEAACSAANLLGTALMTGGPDAAAAMLKKVASSSSSNLSEGEKTKLNALAEKITNRTATFEDLNKAQELMYRAANSSGAIVDLRNDILTKLNPREKKAFNEAFEAHDDDTINRLARKALGENAPQIVNGTYQVSDANRAKDASGLGDGELENLGDMAAATTVLKRDVSGYEDFTQLAEALQPGESMILRLGSNADDNNPSHFVTIGRQKDGTFFIYNPDPGKGDATLVKGGQTLDAKFNKELARYADRQVPNRDDSIPPGLLITA